MDRGATNIWPMAAAWDAAVEVTAVAYGVAPGIIAAESRGRGPRPPKSAWEAKRMAVYVTVVLSACGYAELGRMTGLHRDTIASHCAKTRDTCADDENAERMVDLLTLGATNRMVNSDEQARVVERGRRPKDRASLPELVEALAVGLASRRMSAHSSDKADASRIRDQKPRNAA